MAGDWIKMRTNLDRDPAVVRISSGLKTDRFAVVGRLHTIWAWANEHLVDGQDVPIDSAFLDALVECPGFAEQMRRVGWLSGRDGSIDFPGFERHNGASAKARAMDSDRKKRVRKMSGSQPDENRTREEKRREEEGKQHARAAGAADETPTEADPEPGTHSSDCQHAAGRPKPARGDAGATEIANGRHGAAGDEWRRAGWVHDEWARVVAAWNATERAVPWTLLSPPNGFADLAASPGWVESALAAVAMLPECRRFERPVPWTQFVREIDRILAGEFRDPREDRRELAAAGGAKQQRRGNL
jgi:hypothetical protein